MSDIVLISSEIRSRTRPFLYWISGKWSPFAVLLTRGLSRPPRHIVVRSRPSRWRHRWSVHYELENDVRQRQFVRDNFGSSLSMHDLFSGPTFVLSSCLLSYDLDRPFVHRLWRLRYLKWLDTKFRIVKCSDENFTLMSQIESLTRDVFWGTLTGIFSSYSEYR